MLCPAALYVARRSRHRLVSEGPPGPIVCGQYDLGLAATLSSQDLRPHLAASAMRWLHHVAGFDAISDERSAMQSGEAPSTHCDASLLGWQRESGPFAQGWTIAVCDTRDCIGTEGRASGCSNMDSPILGGLAATPVPPLTT